MTSLELKKRPGSLREFINMIDSETCAEQQMYIKYHNWMSGEIFSSFIQLCKQLTHFTNQSDHVFDNLRQG